MIKNKTLVAFLIVLLLGCQQKVVSQQDTEQPPKNTEEQTVNLPYKGTIKHLALEGGFFGIVTKQGQKILPLNLDKKYQQDGAVIEFSGEFKNVMTIQQWGKPFTINEVRLIKAGKESNKAAH